MSDFSYVGSELELFAAASNWKAYWSSKARPYIEGDVLEVGAGIGSNTPFLDSGNCKRWLCLEPDPALTAQLSTTFHRNGGGQYETMCGTLESVNPDQLFDTIIYIDVLEHIADDREELNAAAGRLRPGGRVIVLSPAHPWLFTPFDAEIGHFRRYNRTMIESISPAGSALERLIYLDSVGLAASAANLFLRQSMPTKEQLRFWDRWMVPVSRVLDKILLHSIGKSIMAVWRKTR